MSAEDFDEFYAACGPPLVRQLYLLTGNREEARDCVQEALERAWLRWDKVSALAEPRAWVRTVARRLAVSRWRKARNAVTAMGRAYPGHARSDGSHELAVRDELVRALQALPAKQRTAVVLHYLCDLDVVAVAEETNSSEGAVKNQLMRGRQALAAHLDPQARTVDSGAKVSENSPTQRPYAQNGLS
jgi:RNA polymerase sigma-70 factor, ECF subfamily